jgi:hypothetical protein
MEQKRANWSAGHSAGSLVAVILLPALDWFLVTHRMVLTAWIFSLILLLFFAMVIGHGIVGAWRGVLIDGRNVISLSRLQMLIWTVVVVSAFLTAAFCNIFINIDDPLAIQVPTTLWALMGISTASLIGSPLILSTKETKNASPEAFEETKTLLASQGYDPADTKNVGQVITNSNPGLANWIDIFTGDETSNGAHLDLAKIQMFFFTIIVAFSYCMLLGKMFFYSEAGGISAFPLLDQSALALIGISHAGYLVNKATPRP